MSAYLNNLKIFRELASDQYLIQRNADTFEVCNKPKLEPVTWGGMLWSLISFRKEQTQEPVHGCETADKDWNQAIMIYNYFNANHTEVVKNFNRTVETLKILSSRFNVQIDEMRKTVEGVRLDWRNYKEVMPDTNLAWDFIGKMEEIKNGGAEYIPLLK